MKIEFDNVKLQIPEGWQDIRLSDYEKWYMLEPKDKFEMVQYVADVCRLDAKVLMQSPTQLFNIISDAIQFIFRQEFEPSHKCTIGGEDYFISFSDKMTLGEYVDIESVLESDSPHKLSEMLAVICRPTGEKYNPDITAERAEMFRNMTCDKALPLISFFLHRKKKLDGILNHCLMVAAQAEQFLKDTETSVANGDGIRQLPIWQKIKYYYLTKSLRKELSKFSDFYCIK